MIKGRAYYSSSINDFMNKNRNEIFGEITSNDQFAASDLQKNAWMQEIEIFKNELVDFSNGHLLFEYTIPRVGKRIDSVILYNGIVFLIEFKVGADKYHQRDIDQVTDYALDLNCFHKESDNKLLVPILVCTEAERKVQEASFLRDNAIIDTYLSNGKDIGEYIKTISKKYHRGEFDPNEWIDSIYMPTPTIIEAATALYEGHNVGDIKSNEAKDNLTITKHAINNIIDKSKKYRRKSICFVTGVPGAGKTLAGLDIAVGRQKADKGEQAVFLSGNGPLVDVLQEALSRDDHDRNKTKRTEAARKAREFIQIIHKFRDEAITVSSPPSEKVVIFDEAQRAWDEENLTNFMKQKKNNPNFKMQEHVLFPEA